MFRSQPAMARLGILVVGASLLVWLACSGDSTGVAAPDPPRPATDQEKQLATATSGFGFDLLREVVAETEPGANVCVSPLSVSVALGMALNGAEGETEAAIRTTLGFGDLEIAEINAGYRDLVALLIGLDPAVSFVNANSAWARDDFELQEPFVAALVEYFAATVRSLPFEAATVDTINDWISDHTRGMVNRMLDRIPADAVLYLVNALFFQANWSARFETEDTVAGEFQRADGTAVSAMFMNQITDLPYLRTEMFEVVDLPYGNGFFGFTAVIPRDGYDISDILAELSPESWQAWRAQLVAHNVDLSLPKFEVEFATELRDMLTALGMGVAFSGEADFSRINPDWPVAISRVLHNTVLKVDEEGTRAAAATVVEVRVTAIEPVVLTLDLPFLFVISDHHAGALMFAGILADPSN